MVLWDWIDRYYPVSFSFCFADQLYIFYTVEIHFGSFRIPCFLSVSFARQLQSNLRRLVSLSVFLSDWQNPCLSGSVCHTLQTSGEWGLAWNQLACPPKAQLGFQPPVSPLPLSSPLEPRVWLDVNMTGSQKFSLLLWCKSRAEQSDSHDKRDSPEIKDFTEIIIFATTWPEHSEESLVTAALLAEAAAFSVDVFYMLLF